MEPILPWPDMQLTTTEQAQLERCEAVIHGGLQTFIEVGNALCEIRDSQLYKQHGTFEEYCQEKWNLSRKRAYDMIGAADVAGNLSPMGDIPTTERQVRPLTKLKEPEQQREAWSEAVETSGGKPTAKDVEAAVEKVKAKAGPPFLSNSACLLRMNNCVF